MEKIMGFPFQKRHCSAFDIIGFTKIVGSGGELYGEVRTDGRWDKLKANGSIYGIASLDEECTEGKYRYTIGVKNFEDEMYRFHVGESDWIIFTIDFESDYGIFWQNDPYNMINELGYSFNNSLGIHIDVFDAEYDGHEMEFWMPVK